MKQEVDSLTNYTVILSDEVYKQLDSIKDYISNVKLSPETANRLIIHILDDLESLQVFPERGFLVAERIGKELSNDNKNLARGLIVGKRKYLALYAVDEEVKLVRVVALVPTSSDWMSLFT